MDAAPGTWPILAMSFVVHGNQAARSSRFPVDGRCGWGVPRFGVVLAGALYGG